MRYEVIKVNGWWRVKDMIRELRTSPYSTEAEAENYCDYCNGLKTFDKYYKFYCPDKSVKEKIVDDLDKLVEQSPTKTKSIDEIQVEIDEAREQVLGNLYTGERDD